MAQYASALATAEQRFGVSRYVVAAIWGVESEFGRAMGKRPLVQSLHARLPRRSAPPTSAAS